MTLSEPTDDCEPDQEKLHGALSKSFDANFLAEVGSKAYRWQLSWIIWIHGSVGLSKFIAYYIVNRSREDPIIVQQIFTFIEMQLL